MTRKFDKREKENMANKGYDPHGNVDFDAKVNDEGKTLRDEINEAFELFKETATKTLCCWQTNMTSKQ